MITNESGCSRPGVPREFRNVRWGGFLVGKGVQSYACKGVGSPSVRLHMSVASPLGPICSVFSESISVLVWCFPGGGVARKNGSNVDSKERGSTSHGGSNCVDSVPAIISRQQEVEREGGGFFKEADNAKGVPGEGSAAFGVEVEEGSNVGGDDDSVLSRGFIFLYIQAPMIGKLFCPFRRKGTFIFSLLCT